MVYNKDAGSKSPSAPCIAEAPDTAAFTECTGCRKQGFQRKSARFQDKKSVDPGACDTAKAKKQRKPLVYKGAEAFGQYNRSTDFLA